MTSIPGKYSIVVEISCSKNDINMKKTWVTFKIVAASLAAIAIGYTNDLNDSTLGIAT